MGESGEHDFSLRVVWMTSSGIQELNHCSIDSKRTYWSGNDIGLIREQEVNIDEPN